MKENRRRYAEMFGGRKRKEKFMQLYYNLRKIKKAKNKQANPREHDLKRIVFLCKNIIYCIILKAVLGQRS